MPSLSMLCRAVVLTLLAVPCATRRVPAQTVTPVVHAVLNAGSRWIGGIAEPRSGRFFAYANTDSIVVVNRHMHATFGVPIKTFHNAASALGVSASGNRIVFLREDDEHKGPFVWVLDLDSLTGHPQGSARRVTIVRSRDPQLSPDGQAVAFVIDDGNHNLVSGGTRLAIVPTEGGAERVLDSAKEGLAQPRWSPDGATIYYERRPALMRIRAAGGRADSIGFTGRFIDASPDGRYLAFVSGPQIWNMGAHSIEISDVDGKILAHVQNDTWEDRVYGWASTSDRLYAVNASDTPNSYELVSITSGRVTPSVFHDTQACCMEYSPNGKLLAASAKRSFRIFDAATGRRRELAKQPGATWIDWQWSPDGRRVAYVLGQSTNGTPDNELHVLDVTTGTDTRLASIGQQVRFHWHSDSRAVEYVARAFNGLQEDAAVTRVNLAGESSIVLRFKTVARTGYQVLDDSLMAAVQYDSALTLIPLNGAAPRTIFRGRADVRSQSRSSATESPDGKWILLTVNEDKTQRVVMVSHDGAETRLLGSALCAAFPRSWMPGGHFIMTQSLDCEHDRATRHITPIDGSPSRLVNTPAFEDAVMTPDGRSLLLAVEGTNVVKINELDLRQVLASRTARHK